MHCKICVKAFLEAFRKATYRNNLSTTTTLTHRVARYQLFNELFLSVSIYPPPSLSPSYRLRGLVGPRAPHGDGLVAVQGAAIFERGPLHSYCVVPPRHLQDPHHLFLRGVMVDGGGCLVEEEDGCP